MVRTVTKYVADTLYNLGSTYHSMAEYSKAEHYFPEAHTIYEKLPPGDYRKHMEIKAMMNVMKNFWRQLDV